jgi:hypothetical protein
MAIVQMTKFVKQPSITNDNTSNISTH